MIQSTSLEAYFDIMPTLSKKQNMVYNIIKLYPGVSNLDISRMLGWAINSVTPRVYELREFNLVTFSHKKRDRITDKTCRCWKIEEHPNMMVDHNG